MDRWWCTADPGWITGHSYLVYGPMIAGVTSMLFEGGPAYPYPNRWWQVIERYGITIFYTAPTAIRGLMRFGASGAGVEVNLFHRTEERMEKVSRLLGEQGVRVLSGKPERLLPLSHDRGLCLREGIGSADVILVPLEDGDRCRALTALGRTVIVIDLNPLSRSAREATLTIVDELTRALPVITCYCQEIEPHQIRSLACGFDNRLFLGDALSQICRRLEHALD